MTNASLRWGDQAPHNVHGARDRLLDAAEACFGQFGIAKTTVEDIAKQASVSRATVYRYFAGRDAVVSGVILRETERYLERVRPRVESQSDLGGVILEFVEVTLRAAVRDETVGLLFTSDHGLDSVGIIEGTSVALFELVSEFLRPMFDSRSDEHHPGLPVEDASEWILRAILSLLTVKGPKRRSGDGLDTYLRRFLLPAILRPTS
ncbi:MAG: TetR/AcrR family transcriptional regulator [Ilumatobacter sp.]|uniref:TetR/AcrR family transcriptional regulator n=1 Tax=Ilumatobacter sp. TaxID=1967498 RepID=UPI003918EC6F